jgi:hypothetical protein
MRVPRMDLERFSRKRSDGSFFLLCYVVCVCLWCVCAPVHLTVTGRSSRCVVFCVCIWSRLCASVSHSDGPFFLLCCVVLCVSVYDLVYALVSPTVTSRSSRCVVFCVCIWSRLCASVSHSDRPFFLLCCVVCVCIWYRLCASLPHSDGSLFLLCSVTAYAAYLRQYISQWRVFNPVILCCVCLYMVPSMR